MEEDKIVLVYPGLWNGPVFQNGEEEVLVFTSLRTKSLKEFLDEVHKLVQADQRVCEYVLHCFIQIGDGIKKSFIMSDTDLQRVAKIFEIPKIYVTLKPKHHGMMNAPPNQWNQSFNHHAKLDKTEENLASQATNANPFLYNFPTDKNTSYPAPNWLAPYFHGAMPGPAPGPVANQPLPVPVPIFNQPKHKAPSLAIKPKPPNSKPVVNNAMKRALEVGQPCKPRGYENDSLHKRRMLDGPNADGFFPVDDEFYSNSEESSC